jgi:hypothetical protein
MYVPRVRRILSRHDGRVASVWARVALASLVGFAAGCAALRIPEAPTTPAPMSPVWDENELRDHLEFLNDEQLMGRATGTQGYARAAAYVAARMREFRLQPAVDEDFRLVYGVSINYPVGSSFSAVGPIDSTAYLRGIDYLPDARSDSGRVTVGRMVVAAGSPPAPDGSAPPPPFAVLVTEATSADLSAWQQAGARLAIVMRDLMPRFHAAPIRGLLVVQVTPRAAAELFGLPEPELSNFLETRRGEAVELPRTLSARVAIDYQPRAGAINMMGYFSGKHPRLQRDLVIVCADLDAAGSFAGVPVVDFGNYGIATSAVLEAARNLSYVTRRWSIPDRSVMIAVWSGSRTGHVGLRHFLEHPTWSLDRVHAVVYAGLSSADEADVRSLLDGYGIRLISIRRAEEPLFERGIVLRPDPSVLRLARSRNLDLTRFEPPDESAILDSAVVRARRLADAAYRRAMLQATEAESFLPVRDETMTVPPALGSQ